MRISRRLALTLLLAAVAALPLRAQWPATETGRSRRHLPHQGRRAAAVEGDGDRELPHRRLRPAAHRLAEHQGSRRLGAEDDEGLGPRQRPPRDAGRSGAAGRTSRFIAMAVTPRAYPLIAYPKAWTPGTNGPVTGEAVVAVINDEQDFDTFRGKLRGKFVLATPMRDVAAAFRRARPSLHRRRARRSVASSRRPVGGRGRGNFGNSGVQPQADAVLDRRRRRGGARLQPRRRRHGLRAGAAGRVARSERTARSRRR